MKAKTREAHGHTDERRDWFPKSRDDIDIVYTPESFIKRAHEFMTHDSHSTTDTRKQRD